MGARPTGGCSGLRDALASRRWSGIGESDPDKRKVGDKVLFLMTCLFLFLLTGGADIWEHL